VNALEQEFFTWERAQAYPQSDVRQKLVRAKLPPRPREGILSAEVAARLIYAAAVMHEESAWSLLLHLELGLTRAALCAIRPQDVDLEEGFVLVGDRRVALTPSASEAARWLLEHRRGETLLGVSPGVFSNRIHRAAAMSGLGSMAGRYILWPRLSDGRQLVKRFPKSHQPALRAVPPLQVPEPGGAYVLPPKCQSRRQAVELL
jgi:integrase